jgi:hypothetical protein
VVGFQRATKDEMAVLSGNEDAPAQKKLKTWL